MRNPELFQGEKYINKNKSYFEGWYFKNTNNENGIKKPLSFERGFLISNIIIQARHF